MGSNSSQKTPSVVLLSGGLDSSANLAIAVERDSVVLCLHADYGQRAEASEWLASKRLAEYYGVRLERVEIQWLGRMGGSSLTDAAQAVPHLNKNQLDEIKTITESARAVWVPNRNGVLINIASAYAERVGAKRVIVGFNREEATTFPDNSGAFLKAATNALSYSTANGVEVFCYTTEMDKRQIVREIRGLSRPFPFDRVWSCYYSGEMACGKCESCGRFNRACESA